eukprot:scaffold3244_cov46-Phaeocystis_antarctica.AAC.3
MKSLSDAGGGPVGVCGEGDTGPAPPPPTRPFCAGLTFLPSTLIRRSAASCSSRGRLVASLRSLR